MKKGLLIILSGPSGVGKGTVRRAIFNSGRLNLEFSISMTTRQMRYNEADGVDYYFVSKEEFERNIKEGNFLEWNEFVGNYYGTPKDKVEELRNQGKNVFLEIEINGATNVINNVHDDRVISFFLKPPSLEDLEARIRHRGSESEEIIQKRLSKGVSEMNKTDLYDYVIVNDNVTRAAQEIITLINKKRKGK